MFSFYWIRFHLLTYRKSLCTLLNEMEKKNKQTKQTTIVV